MSARGRTSPFRGEGGKVRNRRNFAVRPRSSEGQEATLLRRLASGLGTAVSGSRAEARRRGRAGCALSAIFALTDLDVCCELCYSSPFLGRMMRAITAITLLVARLWRLVGRAAKEPLRRLGGSANCGRKGGGRACRFPAEKRGNRRQGSESGSIRNGPIRPNSWPEVVQDFGCTIAGLFTGRCSLWTTTGAPVRRDPCRAAGRFARLPRMIQRLRFALACAVAALLLAALPSGRAALAQGAAQSPSDATASIRADHQVDDLRRLLDLARERG